MLVLCFGGNMKRFVLFVLFSLSFFIFGCERVYVTNESNSSEKAAKPEAAVSEGQQMKEEQTTGNMSLIKERGFIRVGVPSDKPPFGYVDSNGNHQGLNPYIAKQFANDLFDDETKVEFVLVEAATRETSLESGAVDVVLANYTVTDRRKELVDFAYPYMKTALAVVSHKDSPIMSVDELSGKKVLVNENTVADVYFTQNFPEVELIRVQYTSQAYEAIKNGEADAIAHDNSLLFSWAHNNPEFVVGIQSIGETEYIAPGVKKGEADILKWVNEEMLKLGSERFFHEAYDVTLRPAYGAEINPEDVIIEPK